MHTTPQACKGSFELIPCIKLGCMYVIIERKETGTSTPPPLMSRLPSPPPLFPLSPSFRSNHWWWVFSLLPWLILHNMLLLKFGRIKSIVQSSTLLDTRRPWIAIVAQLNKRKRAALAREPENAGQKDFKRSISEDENRRITDSKTKNRSL